MRARCTTWTLAWYYLQGVRKFAVYNTATGQVVPQLAEDEGREFRDQEILTRINAVAGRIQGFDFRPMAKANGASLGAKRDRAKAQAIADAIVSDTEIDRVKEMYAYYLACLGGAGLTGHVVDHPVVGLTSELKVVHPKELAPFPSVGQDYSRTAGIMWTRNIPMDRAREVYGGRLEGKKAELDWFEADQGDSWSDEQHEGATDGSWARGQSGFRHTSDQQYADILRVRELWMLGPGGTVTEYAATSGGVVLQREDYSQMEVYCPVEYSRFLNNGTWHGAGMFDVLFGIHRRAERMLRNLFNNIEDADRYGVLVLPQGEMNTRTFLTDVGQGLKVAMWEPEVDGSGIRPFAMSPVTTGDLPGKVAQFAKDQMAAVDPLKDLVEEKGRADSAAALNRLDQAIGQKFTTVSLNTTRAWGTVYKHLTQMAGGGLIGGRRRIPLKHVNMDLAGLIIDRRGGTASFDEEQPLPKLSGLTFGIQSDNPRSPAAMLEAAIRNWQLGLFGQDPSDFRLWALEAGVDVDLWLHEEKGAYECAVMNVLVLYGNGEQPGELVLTPETSRPELEMKVVRGFMSGPMMKVASPEVVDAFRAYLGELMMFQGTVMPQGMPTLGDPGVGGGLGAEGVR